MDETFLQDPYGQPALPDKVSKLIEETATHPYWSNRGPELWRCFLGRLPGVLSRELVAKCYDELANAWDSVPGSFRNLPDGLTSPRFRLSLTHSCMSMACSDGHCHLCVNDPQKRCPSLLAPKYFINSIFEPRCGARITVVVERTDTGERLSDEEVQASLPPFYLQVCAVPKSYYETNAAHLDWSKVHECQTLTFSENTTMSKRMPETVLSCLADGVVEETGFVSFPNAHPSTRSTAGAETLLPRICFHKKSGEALLGTKQPAIMLLVRAVGIRGETLDATLHHAVSNEFCVTTVRTKGGAKVDPPSSDNEVKVLYHLGDASIKKLKNIATEARQHGVHLPPHCAEVLTVGQFQELVLANDSNVASEKNLFQKLLGMNPEKAGEVRGQLSRTVSPDTRLRVFYTGPFHSCPFPEKGHFAGPVDIGVVFRSQHGQLQLGSGTDRRECGLVLRSTTTAEEVRVAPESIARGESLLHDLCNTAFHSWNAPHHPGWGLYHYNNATCSELPYIAGRPYAADTSRTPAVPQSVPSSSPPTSTPPPHVEQLWRDGPLTQHSFPSDPLMASVGKLSAPSRHVPMQSWMNTTQLAESVTFGRGGGVFSGTGGGHQGVRRQRECDFGSVQLASGPLAPQRPRSGGDPGWGVFTQPQGQAVSVRTGVAQGGGRDDEASRSAQELSASGLGAKQPPYNFSMLFSGCSMFSIPDPQQELPLTESFGQLLVDEEARARHANEHMMSPPT